MIHVIEPYVHDVIIIDRNDGAREIWEVVKEPEIEDAREVKYYTQEGKLVAFPEPGSKQVRLINRIQR